MKITFNETHGAGGYRSKLEADVAAELDQHGVEYGYEEPLALPGITHPGYLPDFTIHAADEDLELPRWVEAKPIDFLYSLRDDLGVTRRAGERFADVVEVDGVTHQTIKDRQIEELWKPKLLAQLTGESVLVLGGVGGQSKLSVTMRPDRIDFSREHPFVNWPGVTKKKERAESQARWRIENANRQRLYEADRAQRQRFHDIQVREIRQSAAATVQTILSHPSHGAPRFASSCAGCSTPTTTGSLHRVGSGWKVICIACRQRALTT